MRVWPCWRWPSRARTHRRCGSARSRISHAIPERYLVQILLQLKGAGLVVSTRGASGGYRLARPAAEISLSDVLAAIDGPDTPRRGLPERNGRPRESWAWSGNASARPSAASSTAPPSPSSSRKPRPTNGPSEVDSRPPCSRMQRKKSDGEVSLVREAGLPEPQEMPFLSSSRELSNISGAEWAI